MATKKVYEIVKKIADKRGIHLSSFGWDNVRKVERESANLSNLQIIERLKREENLRLDLGDGDWREIGRQLK
jgi:hypothetical protein